MRLFDNPLLLVNWQKHTAHPLHIFSRDSSPLSTKLLFLLSDQPRRGIVRRVKTTANIPNPNVFEEESVSVSPRPFPTDSK